MPRSSRSTTCSGSGTFRHNPLSSPSVKPDVGKLLQKRVEEEVKGLLMDKLLGGSKEEPAAEEGAAEEPPVEGEPEEEEQDLEDELKDKLKGLFDR